MISASTIMRKAEDVLSQIEEVADYSRRLKAHDWQFDFSDGAVRRRGKAEHEALIAMQKRIDADFRIWNELAPASFRRNIGR